MKALLAAAAAALVVAASAAAADPFAGAHGGAYTTADGSTVKVFVSAEYPADDSVNRHWADFLGSLIHGPELGLVTLMLASPLEVQQVCGFAAVACYRRSSATIYAPAEPPPEGPSPQELVAHEYGHHVAANRDNPPWSTQLWGTKRWDTAMGICAGVRAGRLHPGNETAFYATNPGEAFAESYRLLNEQQLSLPASPWSQVSRTLLPGAAALAALREDVVDPYAGPRAETLAGSFRRGGGGGVRTFTIRTPLDGTLEATLTAPTGAAFRLALDGTTARRTLVCGRRTLTATVQRVRGYGAFRLDLSVP